MTTRLQDIARFYGLMDRLAQRLGGPRRLADCSGRLPWPQRGVYFFMEEGEVRSHSGSGPLNADRLCAAAWNACSIA